MIKDKFLKKKLFNNRKRKKVRRVATFKSSVKLKYSDFLFIKMKNMFCNKEDLTNESSVEQFFVIRLLRDLGYEDAFIKPKKTIKAYKIDKGNKKKDYAPDYILYIDKAQNKPVILIDAKKPDVSAEQGVSDAQLYASILRRKLKSPKPEQYCIGTNGLNLIVKHYDSDKDLIKLKFSDFQKDNSKYQKLKQLLSFSILKDKFKKRIVPKIEDDFEFNPPDLKKINGIFRACHNIIWKKEKWKPTQAFYEFSKLFFIKLHYDRKIYEEFTKKGLKPTKKDFMFSLDWIKEREKETKNPFNTILFKNLRDDLEEQIEKGKKKRIFNKDESLDMKPSTIKEVVKLLEHYDFHRIDEDLNGRMFETFLNATVRGKELGQFFTPRTVIKFMTKLARLEVNKNKIDRVLDACCGSGGFLIDCMADMFEKINKNNSLSNVEKENLKNEVVTNFIWGIDADRNKHLPISRIARMNMYLHGDGSNRIYWFPDSLDKNMDTSEIEDRELLKEAEELKKFIEDGLKFDVVLTNPPFSMKYRRSEEDEKKIIEEYELIDYKGKSRSSLKSNILFLERYRDLLKPHGKLITIIDDSVLNTPSEKDFRDFIRENFIIKAVISLPRNAFINADTNVKTSVLYLIKKDRKDEKQPDVFMAISENIGHTDAGKEALHLNDLNHILTEFLNFEKGNFKSNDKIFIVSGEELDDRMDCYSHSPIYKRLINKLRIQEKKGKFDLIPASDLNIVDERIKKKEYEKISTNNYKYLELGNTDKDLGLILGIEEDLLINLPTRARQKIQTNDILIPRPIGSTEGIVKVPEELNNQLCSTGFIIIRPKDEDEALLLWAIMKSDLVQLQFFYLQSGSLQPEITPENFKGKVLIPLPKGKIRKQIVDAVKKDIEEAKKYKQRYDISLEKAKSILKNSIF